MRSFLILLFSGLSLLTRAQSRDSVVLPSFNDTSTINYLIPVTAHNNNNKADSIQNRTDYEYIFNYKKKKINMGDNKWNRTMGVMGKKIALNQQKSLSLLDISSLVQNVHSKKNKQKLSLKKRLIQQAQEKFVKQIFTPALVERFSDMHNDDSLHKFIARYAPSYNEIQTMNELDLGSYILGKMKLFRQFWVTK